nr:MAG TPA: hypothetical protein [Caudoviricetes sp.]
MTEPSQYFKGRTVQEQMDEVIGYVDKRAEEVAAAKADTVLQPAEEAKTAAQAAAVAAEAAKDTTLAALPDIQHDISALKAEDTALDGRLNTVELKVQTAEGNIVTIQGQIVALQNVQGDYVKKGGAAQTVTSQIMVPTTATGLRDTQIANGIRIQNDLAAYEPMIRNTGNVSIYGRKAINVASIRNLNGEGNNTSCLELFRFRPLSGQDHRFNFFCQLGMGVCHVLLRIQIPVASVEIIDGTKTPIGNSTGNITIGVGITADGWCVVYEKESPSCIFCSLLTAFTGLRFPLKEANVDMSKQCDIVELTDLSSIKEVTL